MGKRVSVSNRELEDRIKTLAQEISQTHDAAKRRRLQKRRGHAEYILRQRGAGAETSSSAETVPAQLDTESPAAAVPPAPEFQTVEAPPKPPRSYRPRVTSAKAQEEEAQKAKDEAAAQAAMFLLMLDSLAVSTAGEEARLNDIERTLIEPALARMLARIDAQRAAMIQRYADPLMILAGSGLWLVRMREIQKERKGRRDDNSPPPPGGAPDASPPPNGDGQKVDLSAMKLHSQIQGYYSSPEREL